MSNDNNDIAIVTQVVLRERQGRDRGWWKQMADSYWPDSEVNISWCQGTGQEFAKRSEGMSSRGDKALHRLCPPIVHIKGDRAFVEIPGAIEFRFDMNGVLADLSSFTRLYFRLERRQGVWKIKTFTAVYERDTLTPAIPGQALKVDPEVFKPFRTSYAMLSYYLSMRGYPISSDLVGDDRPEGVEAFYKKLWAWLDGGPL